MGRDGGGRKEIQRADQEGEEKADGSIQFHFSHMKNSYTSIISRLGLQCQGFHKLKFRLCETAFGLSVLFRWTICFCVNTSGLLSFSSFVFHSSALL